MNKVSYVLKRISQMDFKEMLKTAKRISKENNASFFYVLLDIIYCGIKYMAGYVDYEVFDFYNLTAKQRKTIITRGVNNKFVSILNNGAASTTLDNKLLFNEKYNNFLGRDWLNLNLASKDEFNIFVKNKNVIIAKPHNQSCGKGVEKIAVNTTTIDALYDNLIKNNQILIEENIIQHPQMANLYSNAVNTLRIVTINKNNVVHIVFKSIRIGNAGNVVDNFNHGGLFAIIDDFGIISSPAVDKKGNIYTNHPFTNHPIVGFKIPLFDNALDLVKDMAAVTPEVGYVGWDIAITPTKAIVIEANPFPGHDIYYSKAHAKQHPDGLRQKFEKIIYEG